MFLLFWLILLISGTRKQSRNRPAFRVQLRHGASQMAATFFQSVMEGERRRVSPKPSQALSPNDLGDSFGARIFRDAKTRAVFPSRYSGKAKLAQFSRPDIAGKQNSRNFPVPL